MLSCASLKGFVTLSHAPQLSVTYPQEEQLGNRSWPRRDSTRGALLRREIQKRYPVACTWLCVFLVSRFCTIFGSYWT